MININKVKPISFKARIIDSHTHLGNWEQLCHGRDSLDVFVNTNLDNGDVIEKMLVSNLDCIARENISDELVGNKKLLTLIEGNRKYVPLAVCQPNITCGDISKIEQLFGECPHRFVGLKFHPKYMELPADSFAYDNYLRLAEKYNLPCLFHSDKTFDVDYGFGNIDKRCEFSRPEQIYTLAKRHKKVPVILGHMGGNSGQNCKSAVDIIVDSIEKSTANLYADISWVNAETAEKPDIIEAIKRLKNTRKGDKTDRLLFGTDAPLGRFCRAENNLTPQQAYQKVVNDIKNAIKQNFPQQEADELIDKIFYKNADTLFFSPRKSKVSFINKNKPLLFVAVAIAAISTILGGVIVKNKNSNDSIQQILVKPSKVFQDFKNTIHKI